MNMDSGTQTTVIQLTQGAHTPRMFSIHPHSVGPIQSWTREMRSSLDGQPRNTYGTSAETQLTHSEYGKINDLWPTFLPTEKVRIAQ